MTAKKGSKTDEKVNEAVADAAPAPVAYRVDAEAFQAALNVLAELPYNKVGNLLNALRAAKAITEEDEA